MTAWHLTWASDGRAALFPEESTRLAAVQALARVAGSWATLFAIVDDHVHLALISDRTVAGRVARNGLVALRKLTTAPLEPAHIRAVETRAHARWLVTYLLDQPRKHGLPAHPALWSGSCFPDLTGARAVPGFSLGTKMTEILPRFRLREAYAAVGLPPTELAPVDGDRIRRLGADRLCRAAAAVFAEPFPLHGKRAPTTLARATACHLGRRSGIPTSELIHVLAITPQAVLRLAEKDVDPDLLRAVALRLALEEIVTGTLTGG